MVNPKVLVGLVGLVVVMVLEVEAVARMASYQAAMTRCNWLCNYDSLQLALQL
jgi:hypothetical protein